MTDQSAEPVEVLFLTGQPGAGKTAAAKEISDLLWKIREPHAVIELDELCRGVIPVKTPNFNRELAVANLKVVWMNFYAAGVRRLILSRIIESVDDLTMFSAAIPNAQITVCWLQSPAETVQQRLTEREPGTSRAFLLGLTSRIAAQMADLDLPGIRVENGHRSVHEVAHEILERIHWPKPA